MFYHSSHPSVSLWQSSISYEMFGQYMFMTGCKKERQWLRSDMDYILSLPLSIHQSCSSTGWSSFPVFNSCSSFPHDFYPDILCMSWNPIWQSFDKFWIWLYYMMIKSLLIWTSERRFVDKWFWLRVTRRAKIQSLMEAHKLKFGIQVQMPKGAYTYIDTYIDYIEVLSSQTCARVSPSSKRIQLSTCASRLSLSLISDAWKTKLRTP